MTICSMTGYAVTTHETSSGTLTIEVKSVNSRFLDLQFRINDDLRALEPVLREAIMARLTRGKVECRLSFGRKVANGATQALNQAHWTQSPSCKLKYAAASPMPPHSRSMNYCAGPA